MPSTRQVIRPTSLPSGRIGSNHKALRDNFYLFCIAKLRLFTSNRKRLCTNWLCKYNNPPQAVPGHYICCGCNKGTYVILPSETIDISDYPPPIKSSNRVDHNAVSIFREERRQKVQDRIELKRDLQVRYVKSERKPLPGIPGLELRKRNSIGSIPGPQPPVTVWPPKEDSYFPPLRAKHSFAARNLRQRQLLHPVNELRANEYQAPGQLHRQPIPIPRSQASSFSQHNTPLHAHHAIHLDNGRSYF